MGVLNRNVLIKIEFFFVFMFLILWIFNTGKMMNQTTKEEERYHPYNNNRRRAVIGDTIYKRGLPTSPGKPIRHTKTFGGSKKVKYPHLRGGAVPISRVTEEPEFTPSSYGVPVNQVLHTLPPDNFALCIDYGSDVQCCISGTLSATNHNPDITALAELEEETGLTGPLERKGTVTMGRQTWYIYCQDVANLTALTDPGVPPSAIHDDATQKVAIVVYGSKENILRRMEEIAFLRYSTDEFVGLAAVKVSTLTHMC